MLRSVFRVQFLSITDIGSVCPWYSYSQILVSSVTPRGHEFLFFSLFSVIGKTSSFIGPLVSSAIIDASPNSDNNSAPFYFLFALSVVSGVFLMIFLNEEKSIKEQEDFLEQKQHREEKLADLEASKREVGMTS